jgi:hypothetical protein
MAMTLYDKLKPEIKAKLDKESEKYSTIGYIYDKLKNKNQYNELTIDEIKTIHTFTDIWYKDVDSLDLIYGDHLFNQKL